MKCPVPHVEWEYRSDDEERTSSSEVCGGDLFLQVQGYVSLDEIDDTEVLPLATLLSAHCFAVGWKVECDHGHVIAVSSVDKQGSDESAEPFDMGKVLKIGPKFEDLMVLRNIEKGLR